MTLRFYLKNVAKQKYISHTYMKIIFVFTPNTRGLWYQFGVAYTLHIRAIWKGAKLLAAQIYILILLTLKLYNGWFENKFRQVDGLNLTF